MIAPNAVAWLARRALRWPGHLLGERGLVGHADLDLRAADRHDEHVELGIEVLSAHIEARVLEDALDRRDGFDERDASWGSP